MRRFLFICGCARSGTSALVQLLNAHPEISIGMERYISRFLSGGGLLPELFEEQRFFLAEKGDTFYEHLDFYKSLYDSLRAKWSRSVVIGDKIPKLYTKYAQVFDRFPAARVIFVSRNLIDVASSYKRRAEDEADYAWSGKRDAMRAIEDWNAANSKTVEARKQFPDQIYILAYERLFIDGTGLDELFDFIGLKPSPDIYKYFQFQLQRSSAIRAQRSESLSVAEKLAICLRADSRSFAQLDSKSSVAMLASQRTPTMAGKSSPSKIASLGAGSAPSENTAPKAGKYQDSDHAILDYKYAQLSGTETLFRGPIPEDLSGGFITCLGGAHTLGRFVEQPYPALLQKQLGIPVLNLGHGGGKPEFYLQSAGVLEIINRSKCAVIQVMSARGSPNRYLKPTSHSHNIMRIAKDIPAHKNPAFVDAAYRILLKQLAPEKVQEAISETRAAWLQEMGKLLERITVPKLLLWFSVRTPAYVEGFNELDALLGEYPQLVNEDMIKALRVKAQTYIQCVSNQGMPYELRDAQSHDLVNVFPWQESPAVNYYYPSAEMHSAAAADLAPALISLIK